MRIRAAEPADAAALKNLHMASWRSAYASFAPATVFGAPLEHNMAERWDTWPADRLIRVAEDDGILGFAAVEWKAQPYLDNLHIRPDLRGTGLGRRLFSDLAAVLLAGGHRALSLTVIAGNAPARGFYRRCGGREGPLEEDDLLGHPIRVYPVHWDRAALAQMAEEFAHERENLA
ncbi:MAG: GNAT family N-acetyltransferase [Pseudomonadota bacterium]